MFGIGVERHAGVAAELETERADTQTRLAAGPGWTRVVAGAAVRSVALRIHAQGPASPFALTGTHAARTRRARRAAHDRPGAAARGSRRATERAAAVRTRDARNRRRRTAAGAHRLVKQVVGTAAAAEGQRQRDAQESGGT